MKLKCGVVGLGRGRQFVSELDAIADCEVIAVCDPNPATFKGLDYKKCHTDFETFLQEKLDLVALISPGPQHATQTLACLSRGMHVICETPCVYSIDEARSVVSAVQKTGLKYMLAENYPWLGWCESFKEMAADGKFGEVLYADGDYTHDCRDYMLVNEKGFVPYAKRSNFPGAKKTWRATNLPPIQYCSHTLGPLLTLMNDRVVSAYGLSVGGKAAPDLCDTDIESALFQTAKGAMIRLTNGFTVAHPMSLYYNLVGTKGSAMLFWADTLSAKWWSEKPESVSKWQTLPTDGLIKRRDGKSDVGAMLEEFIASIRKDTKPPFDVHESLDMTLPGIIAHQSGLAGGVKLPVPNSRDWK